jgi:hypothetical protein
MAREIRVRGVRRKQIDEEKLAYAFLLLARTLIDNADELADSSERKPEPPADEEAA